MRDETGSWFVHLLDRQLDPDVAASVTVVDRGHRPRELCWLAVVITVVVAAVIGQLLHLVSQPDVRVAAPAGRLSG